MKARSKLLQLQYNNQIYFDETNMNGLITFDKIKKTRPNIINMVL